MDRLRVIHVGLGRWGFDWAKTVFHQAPEVEVVAYVDRDAAALSRAQATLGVSAEICFTDLAVALRAVDAEAVVIALPIDLHVEVAMEALEAGKHVLVEKPFAPSPAQALPVVSLAERLGLTLMVSQNYRHSPVAIATANLVRSGELGALRSVKIDFRKNAPRDGYPYWGLPNPLLVDMSVHHFDLMRMIIGEEPVELNCRTWNPPGSPFEGHPSGAIVSLFPSGVTVSYRGTWLDEAPQSAWAGEWQMDFENGALFWTLRDPLDLTAGERLLIQRKGGPVEEAPTPNGRRDRPGVLQAFSEAIRTGREPAYFTSGRNNLGTLEIIDATLRSAAARGAPVTLARHEPIPPQLAAAS